MRVVIRDSDIGLSPVQIMILRILTEHGEMSQNNLIKLLSKDKSQVTRLVHDLEEKKLVARTQSKTDKRGFTIKASKNVCVKIERFVQEEKAVVAEMLRGASAADMQNFNSMLVLMNRNIQ